jgi:ribosomal-protein-serine acetyltransferase
VALSPNAIPPPIQLLPPHMDLQEPLVQLLHKLPLDSAATVPPFPAPDHPDEVQRFLFDAIRFFQGGQKKIFFIQCRQELVGSVALFRSTYHPHAAELGFWLALDARGQGIMFQACSQILDRAFRKWGVHRITLQTFPDNHTAQELAMKLGFQKEGRLREVLQANRQYQDLDLYSLLASDWQLPKSNESL